MTRNIELRLDADPSKQYLLIDGEHQTGVCGIGLQYDAAQTLPPTFDVTYLSSTLVRATADVVVDTANDLPDETIAELRAICYRTRRQMKDELVWSGESNPQIDEAELFIRMCAKIVESKLIP